jgi:hypothetical protein
LTLSRNGSRLILIAATSISSIVNFSPYASAADMALKAPSQSASQAASDANSSVFWLSSDFKSSRVEAGNAGGIYAFSGNLDAPGWLVRGQFTYVGYDFSSTLAPSDTAHGTFGDGSSAIGYQLVGPGVVASGFVGVDYQNYTTNPAAAAGSGVGNGWGAAFFGRVASASGVQYPFAVDGDYLTMNNTFWVRGRPGVRFDHLTFGPEVIGMGNNVYDEVRAGAYVSYDVLRYFIVQADLGYADAVRGENTAGGRGGSGVYGGITLVFLH